MPGTHAAITSRTYSQRMEVVGPSAEIRLTETDQTAPAGRYRLQTRSDVLFLERQRNTPWDEPGAFTDTTVLQFTPGAADTDWGTLEFGLSGLSVGLLGPTLTDDALLRLGADGDQVELNHAAGLAADTALADVLLLTTAGSRQAFAANSRIVSNITTSGDYAVYVNVAGTSREAVLVDASAQTIDLGFGGFVTQFQASGIGTTPTDRILLANTAAAAAGAQQYSPALHWRARGWKTNATAASQSVDFRAYVVPVEAAANPTAYLTYEVSVNGAAYTEVMRLDYSAQTGRDLGPRLMTVDGPLLHSSGSEAVYGNDTNGAYFWEGRVGGFASPSGRIAVFSSTAAYDGQDTGVLRAVIETENNYHLDLAAGSNDANGFARPALRIRNGSASALNLAWGNRGIQSFEPIGIGSVSAVNHVALQLGRTWTATASGAAQLLITNGTITAAVNGDASGADIGGTIAEAASGVHGLLTTLRVRIPSITGGVATTTEATTLYVYGAPTIGVNNYAMHIAAGTSLFGVAGTATGVLALAGATSGVVTVTVAATAGTWTMTLPAAVGTAGFQLTDAAGDGVTSWAAAASRREWKHEIADFSDYRGALQQMLQSPLHTFRYKQGSGTGDYDTRYMGIIADESPWATHFGGSIINPVNTVGYMVAGFRALNEVQESHEAKILRLEARVAELEARLAA